MKEANISLPMEGNFQKREHQKLQRKAAIVQKGFFLFGSANSPDPGGIPLYMKTKLQLSALFLGAALMCGSGSGWSQQSNPDTSAKQDLKNAGHETKNAAKDAGSATKKGTKKAYNATEHGTKKAVNKTKNTTKGAVNGAKEGAKQPD
jgi:hypothetical protein